MFTLKMFSLHEFKFLDVLVSVQCLLKKSKHGYLNCIEEGHFAFLIVICNYLLYINNEFFYLLGKACLRCISSCFPFDLRVRRWSTLGHQLTSSKKLSDSHVSINKDHSTLCLEIHFFKISQFSPLISEV